MAKVALRVYNKEIEKMVEQGQLDEAIAHCRHVLNAFPKNLETYRLLGKSYLESKRYNEATDIFERVLMAVPDDFVAHVGMSIINDEQKNMDAAIWHMERAFEVQPANAAIQVELQRLYGRRDGVEPPKIRLTRGALAHMYVQGELHPQAISEINSVLEEDPNRHDMQVLLSRAYFHAGQNNEAAEICSQLLRRYPYCFDANRVLVELVPESERKDSTQTYRQRINELDPYCAFVTGSVFNSDQVADVAISLEKLDWDGQPVDMQPEWSKSLGIGKSEGTGADEPDWLKSGLTDDIPVTSPPVASSSKEDEPAPVPGSLPIPTEEGSDIDKSEIPDFMREAGWGEDTGAFQEGSGTFEASGEASGETPAEPIAEGELPDWVQSMAPSDTDGQSTPLEAAPIEDITKDDVPDWLQGIGDAQSEIPVDRPETAELERPDWLDTSTPEEKPAADAETLEAEQDQPEWLESVKPAEGPVAEALDQATDTPEEGESLPPDWLKSIQPDEEVPPSEPQDESSLEIEVETKELSELQIGKKGSDPQEVAPVAEEPAQSLEEATPPVAVVGVDDLGTSAEEQDDAVAWLEGLAEKQGAKPEELVTDPESRKDEAPDWVKDSQPVDKQAEDQTPAPQEAAPVAEEPAQPIEEAPPPVTAVGADDLGTSVEEQDDAVAWLESLAEKHGAKSEELVTDPESRKDEAPDWVQAAKSVEEQAEDETPAPQEAAPVDEEPVQPVEETTLEKVEEVSEPAAMSPVEEGAPVEEPVKDDTDWIKNAKEVGESLFAELEESQTKEPLPDDSDETGIWLRDLGQEADFKDEQPTESTEAENVSEWLEKLDADDADDEAELEAAPEMEATPETVGEAASDTPDWLQSLEDESSETDSIATSAENAEGENLPSWLAGLDDDKAEQEQPADMDDNLPDWLSAETEQEQEPAKPEPTAPTDWQPATTAESAHAKDSPPAITESDQQEEELPTPEPALVMSAETEPKPQPEPDSPGQPKPETNRQPTGALSDAHDPLLVQAQGELTRNDIKAAIRSYGNLIKRGKLLDEVIFDLREALYRFPVEVSILQTLGDAYMRANRLQDALDSYTKAEELLR